MQVLLKKSATICTFACNNAFIFIKTLYIEVDFCRINC